MMDRRLLFIPVIVILFLGTAFARGSVTPLKTYSITTPDGLTISAQEWGNPNGPEILFIHGFSQSHLSWGRQVGSELAKTFRMVTYDMRGHGMSSKPLEPQYYKENKRWADELKAVIKQTGLKRPVIVGWSYAGRVILDYLMTYGDDGIAGINFVDAVTDQELNAKTPAGATLRAMMSGDLAENIAATRKFLRICFTKRTSEAELETMVGYNMMVPAKVRAAMAGRPTPYEDTLKKIRVPVLVTQFKNDQIVLPQVADHTLAMVAGAKASIYKGSGHAPFWEDPSRFNRELAGFVTMANIWPTVQGSGHF